MKLLSVNVGQPRPSPWASVKVTGIDKRSVDGPVMVTPAMTLERELLPRILAADALPDHLRKLATRRTGKKRS